MLPLRLLCHSSGLFLLMLRHVEADCVGDTLNYNSSGIFVPFKNLCGRDINATVDFVARHVTNRNDCLGLCVSRTTLCYGFDYNEAPRSGSVNNCYLMGGMFEERDTIPEATGNAAMLMPEFRNEYLNQCGTRGLQECLHDQRAAPTSGSASNATTLQNSPVSTSRLSTGSRVGIGSAVAVVVSLVILAVASLLLNRRKTSLCSGENICQTQTPDFEKSVAPSDADGELGLREQCTQEMGPADAHELGGHDLQELEVTGTYELGIRDTQELEAIGPLATEPGNTKGLVYINNGGLGHDNLGLDGQEAQHTRLTTLRICHREVAELQ